jgi:hypothetical protein
VAAKRSAMWKQDESGRVHTPFEPVVLVATLSLIPVLIIEADTKSDGWLRFAEVANWVIWGVFVVELVAVLVFAQRKMAALRAVAARSRDPRVHALRLQPPTARFRRAGSGTGCSVDRRQRAER